MTKELEALERIKSYFNPKQLLTKEKTLNDLEIIENALNDYEWLKSVISVDMFDQLPTPEDKIRFLKIMGVEL